MYPDAEIVDYITSNEVEFLMVFHKQLFRVDSILVKFKSILS